MFFFVGDPEEQANMYWDSSLGLDGPGLESAPLDELTGPQLRDAMAYARMTCDRAIEDGAPAEVQEILLERHDEVFFALAAVDENFQDKIKKDRIVWLGGYSQKNVRKYKRLAKKALAN